MTIGAARSRLSRGVAPELRGGRSWLTSALGERRRGGEPQPPVWDSERIEAIGAFSIQRGRAEVEA
jgi:hypothetical protein